MRAMDELRRWWERCLFLRSLQPVSRKFGLDRGQAIDRFYIERFLLEQSLLIQGVVFEMASRGYTRRFGGEAVACSVVISKAAAEGVDFVVDLETGEGLPVGEADCFILTQTLLCIFDVQAAARHALRALKPGGWLLLTVPGITQISRYDHERWGQYWSFTDQSLRRLFEPHTSPENIQVKTYGNVKAASAFLYGLAAQELSLHDLEVQDPDYPLLVAAAVRRRVDDP